MKLCFWREKMLLEGWMPERALLRLRRAGISLYNVEKTAKNRILFRIKRKDIQKIFAIYPNLCYNTSTSGAYRVQRLGAEGVGKYLLAVKNRIGMALGGLLALALVCVSQAFVLDIEVLGATAYQREVLAALEEVGIRKFSPYRMGGEDLVCAKLLSLDGVEFCSVKKTGNRVAVELRLSPFPTVRTEMGKMQAKHTGEIVSMAVLRGSALKGIGETVRTGETLVEDSFSTEQGGQVRVEIIARVCIACVWEGNVEAESEQEAFAKAYLAAALSEYEDLHTIEIQNEGKTYRVRLAYNAVETMNF